MSKNKYADYPTQTDAELDLEKFGVAALNLYEYSIKGRKLVVLSQIFRLNRNFKIRFVVAGYSPAGLIERILRRGKVRLVPEAEQPNVKTQLLEHLAENEIGEPDSIVFLE